MNNKEKIEEKLAVLEHITAVKVSDSFKNNVLVAIRDYQKEGTDLVWFTPKLQIAAMIVVLVVNAMAITYAFSNGEAATFETFAVQYGLDSNASF